MIPVVVVVVGVVVVAIENKGKKIKRNLKILQWRGSWTQCNRKGLKHMTKGKLNINYDRKGSEHIEKKENLNILQ